jgi:hypothetical protein
LSAFDGDLYSKRKYNSSRAQKVPSVKGATYKLRVTRILFPRRNFILMTTTSAPQPTLNFGITASELTKTLKDIIAQEQEVNDKVAGLAPGQ